MKITLSPMRHDTPLEVSRTGNVLVVNGSACNLSKGETCDWIIGQPIREDGVWQVTLILPHGANAPPETLFPAPILLSADGPVSLPPHDAPPLTDVPDSAPPPEAE